MPASPPSASFRVDSAPNPKKGVNGKPWTGEDAKNVADRRELLRQVYLSANTKPVLAVDYLSIEERASVLDSQTLADLRPGIKRLIQNTNVLPTSGRAVVMGWNRECAGMTSGKEKAAALQAKRKAKRDAARAARKSELERLRRQRLLDEVDVNAVAVDLNKLAGYQGSYSVPLFVTRGFYVPIPFTCKGCGKDEIWTPRQQKWWYEEAKGDPFSTATRCRPCRRRQRDQRNAQKRASEAGRAKKAAHKAGAIP